MECFPICVLGLVAVTLELIVARSPQLRQLQAWLLLSQFPPNIAYAHASCTMTVDLATTSSVSVLSPLALLDK